MPNKKFTNSLGDALEGFWTNYVGWGRATRSEYWWVVLWYNLVVSSILGMTSLWVVWWLATIVPGFCLTARRLHDAGYSNWCTLLYFIPIAGWIAMIVLLCQKSEKKANQWGKPRI